MPGNVEVWTGTGQILTVCTHLSLNPVTVENDATKAKPSRNDRNVPSKNQVLEARPWSSEPVQLEAVALPD